MCAPPWPVFRKQKIEWHKLGGAEAATGEPKADGAASEADGEVGAADVEEQ